jgi:hypothetical protein
MIVQGMSNGSVPSLPSIYETAPTLEGADLLKLGHRGVLAAAAPCTTSYSASTRDSYTPDSPLGPLWRLLVAAKVASVPHTRDPTLLTYVSAPPGMKALHSTFYTRKGCSLVATGGELHAMLVSPS